MSISTPHMSKAEYKQILSEVFDLGYKEGHTPDRILHHRTGDILKEMYLKGMWPTVGHVRHLRNMYSMGRFHRCVELLPRD
jgi:hypothetical protein